MHNKYLITPSKILAIFFIFYLIFFINSCSDPSSSNKVTFSGTVTLEDTTDFSGVTVSLYALVELDTALVRINEQYPNIGIQVSQETEFDHREHEPLYSTTTGADGSWEIKDVDNVEYNVVAKIDDFFTGVRYSVNSEDLIELNFRKLVLLKNNDALISNTIYTVNAGTELNVLLGSNTVENMTILLNENSVLSFNISAGEYSIKNIKIISENNGRFEMHGSKNAVINLENFQVHGYTSIIFDDLNQLILNNIYLDDSKILDIKNLSECRVSKLLCTHRGLINFFYNDSVFFENSVIIGEENTGISFQETKLDINNCYFNGLPDAIFSGADNSLNVVHSEFYYCEEAIHIEGYMNGFIDYNIFKNNKYDMRLFGYYGVPKPTIFQNNFFNTQNYVITMLYVYQDIPCHNNYWNTVEESKIHNKIYDNYNDARWGTVVFQPFLTTPDLTAGINE